MKDILILGSEGFIGRNLVAGFLKKDWRVSGIDHFDNPTQQYQYQKQLGISDFTELLLRNRYGYIVNAAGSGNVGFSVSHPLGDFESNCFEVARILDAVRVATPDTAYMHISSAAVYGNPESIPVKEAHAIQPLSPYGWHKYMSELLCREYHQLYNIRCCVIRPFSVYGPGLRKQLFWDIYNKAAGKSAIELFGTGKESRDFIYIDDLVAAVDILLQNAAMHAECYNVANGIETTIKQAAEEFVKHFPHRVEVGFNGQAKSGDPLNWRGDISRLTALGFKPGVQIEEGLQRTYDWISRNA